MSVALIALIVLWWGLIAYAVLGGADFGAGVWDLLAFGKLAERHRKLINHALGPVWEANHTWLIFLIVGLFNVFPGAFATLFTALFVPFSLVLIGIVLRGAAFIFSYYAVNAQGPFAVWWKRIFSVTCLVTPFFLGDSAAAVASGNLLTPDGTARADLFASWTSPFALTIGAMAVVLCATLAAVYLTVEARGEKDEDLAEQYRLRALIAGAVTAGLGALGLFFFNNPGPYSVERDAGKCPSSGNCYHDHRVGDSGDAVSAALSPGTRLDYHRDGIFAQFVGSIAVSFYHSTAFYHR